MLENSYALLEVVLQSNVEPWNEGAVKMTMTFIELGSKTSQFTHLWRPGFAPSKWYDHKRTVLQLNSSLDRCIPYLHYFHWIVDHIPIAMDVNELFSSVLPA